MVEYSVFYKPGREEQYSSDGKEQYVREFDPEEERRNKKHGQ